MFRVKVKARVKARVRIVVRVIVSTTNRAGASAHLAVSDKLWHLKPLHVRSTDMIMTHASTFRPKPSPNPNPDPNHNPNRNPNICWKDPVLTELGLHYNVLGMPNP